MQLPASTTEAELLAVIDTLNARDDVDGILVQLPLPAQINEDTVTEHILPTKDVDGFHLQYRPPGAAPATAPPCTPKA